MFQITHPQPTIMRTPILITYEVCQPNIIIHTPTSTSPILCISELLNVDVITHAVVCMHNSSNVPAYFLWGPAVGKQKDSMELQFNPKAGVIRPRDTFKVTVSLKPHETGILEYVFVPCFVGRVTEPVMLTVMCAVDNIHVRFELPIQEGKYQKVLWPPKIVDEYNVQSFNNIPFTHEEDDLISYLDTKCCFEKILKNRNQICINNDDDDDDVNDDHHNDDDQRFEIPPQLDCNEETPKTDDEIVVNVQKPVLKDYFGADLILEDYHLEIPQVPLRTRNNL